MQGKLEEGINPDGVRSDGIRDDRVNKGTNFGMVR